MFEKLLKETQELLTVIMSALMEIASIGEAITTEGLSLEVTSVEVRVEALKSPRSPNMRATPPKVGPKTKNDKQKETQSVCELPRKHQKKENPIARENGNIVELESEKDVEYISVGVEDIDMGVEDIDAEGVDPISKLPAYVPSCQDKLKVPKDINENKVTLFTPLLPDKITFKGQKLVHVPHFKLEDWDLEDTECFPQLVTDTFMQRIFFKYSSVIVLEPR